MGETVRTVSRKFRGAETMEEAESAFIGCSEIPRFPSSTLFFCSIISDRPDPADYVKGFPWHPHRGLETVTYMLSGKTEHEDSLGNQGVIDSGDVQWMSAGSGIMHQEMPKAYGGAPLRFPALGQSTAHPQDGDARLSRGRGYGDPRRTWRGRLSRESDRRIL